MSTTTLSRGQRSVSKKLGGYISDNLNNGVSYYNGQLTAPMDPSMNALGAMLRGYDPSGFNQMAQGGFQTLMGMGQAPIPGGGTEAPAQQIGLDPIKHYWEQSTLNPMMYQFNKVIKPQIKASYAGQSGFSSRQGTQIADAYNQTMMNAQNQLGQMQNQGLQMNAQLQQAQMARQNARDIAGAGMAMQGYGDQINNAQQMAGLAANQGMMGSQQAGALAQALNPLQQQANLGASNQYNEYLRTQKENSPWVQLALQYMGIRSQVPSQSSNPWGTVLGAALPLAAGAAGYYMGQPSGGQSIPNTGGIGVNGQATSAFGRYGSVL